MIFKNVYRAALFLLLLTWSPSYAHSQTGVEQLSYYINIQDFIDSFIEIPTSNVSAGSTTIASKSLAGRAPLYNELDVKVGTCSASFLSIQNPDGIFTDISTSLSVDDGIAISWLTPAKPINLDLDTAVRSMVTEATVVASTKIGLNPFYGETFNMVVSADNDKIYFDLTSTPDPTPTPTPVPTSTPTPNPTPTSTPVPALDLVVTGLRAQKLSSGKFLCSFKVTNSEAGTSAASVATITRAKTRNPAADKGAVIKTFNIPALAAGAVSVKFQVIANQEAAEFCVVDLDTTSVVLETDEVNNRQAKKIS